MFRNGSDGRSEIEQFAGIDEAAQNSAGAPSSGSSLRGSPKKANYFAKKTETSQVERIWCARFPNFGLGSPSSTVKAKVVEAFHKVALMKRLAYEKLLYELHIIETIES